jgi:hypothetical protein
MRILALLVALFIMVVGVAGVFAPDVLIRMGRYVVTPGGLYSIAVLRVGIGLVLILVARISRAPKTLRVVGTVVLVAGLATPLFGVERTRAVLEWESTQGAALIRIGGGLALALGGVLTFAVTSGSPLSKT